MNPQSTTQKTLIVQGIAGLGDRLLALLVGILYGRLANRAICVDWKDEFYANKGDNIFDHLFELKSLLTCGSVDESAPACPAIWQGFLHLSLPDLLRKHGLLKHWDRQAYIRLCCVDLESLHHPEAAAVFCLENDVAKLRPHLAARMPQLASLSSEEILKHTFTAHLTLRPDLQAAVDAFVEAHFRSPMVGIHVRSTKESGMRMFESQHFHREVARIKRRHPNVGLFVATDNRKALEEFLGKYDRVVYYQKWFDRPGEPLHSNRSACPDPIGNLKDAAIEIYLLSRCDYLVIPGNSGFSNVASLISAAEPRHKVLLMHSAKSAQSLRGRLRRTYQWVSSHLNMLKRLKQ